MTDVPLRLAIIGMGPKGINALGHLLRRWEPSRPLEVHCIDSRPVGHGLAFGLDQPDYLRLNVNPVNIQMDPLPALDEWLRTRGMNPFGAVPRSMVGRYLTQAFHAMVRHAPAGVEVVVHEQRAESLHREDGAWVLDLEHESLVVDEVLLTLGHAPSHDEALSKQWVGDPETRLIPVVYPVEEALGLDQVPPKSIVAVRGAGLTFVDALLALTEGRDPADWPRIVLPTAPSGMLGLAQPGLEQQLDPVCQAGLAQVASELPEHPLQVLDTVEWAAAQLMMRYGYAEDVAMAAVHHTARTGWEPDLVDQQHRALMALNRSIAIGEAAHRPGAAYMLGRAWANLFPTVVSRLSFHGMPQDVWDEFHERCRILNRLSFGPALPNAIKLSGLVERGVVGLSWLRNGVHISDKVHDLPPGHPQPDVVVDAVLSPPGARTARSPLLDSLLGNHDVSLAEGRRGVAVDRTGQCLDATGAPVPGLSAIGRLTEDVVLGHDTLDQSVHELGPNWAARLAAR